MQTITVNAPDSKGLQKLIDYNGNDPAEYILQNDLLINSVIRFYNYADFDGGNYKLTLMQDAPVNPFGEQVPIVGSKYSTGVKDLKIHDIIFDGKRDYQSKVPTNISHAGPNKNWGIGYHNFIGIGNLKNPIPANSSNCEFYNLEFNNNLGDGIRIEGGTDIIAHDIKGKRGGHDIICYSGVSGGEICNLDVDLAVNAGVRTRSSRNIKIHDCKINGNTGLAYSPGIQIQSTAKNWISSEIEIYNNYIYGTYGPGIQIAGTVPHNGLVTVKNNLIVSCGRMPAGNKISGVGGIVFDGFDVDIQNNTIYECLGYGLKAGPYDVVSAYKNTATIKNNIIISTEPALYPGVSSGCGISDLTGGRYVIVVDGNCQYGNKQNHYKVNYTNGVSADPCFVDPDNGDYHLKISSPCVFPTGEFGRYSGTQEATKYLCPGVTIFRDSEEDLRAYVRALREAGYIENEDEIKFINVSDDFQVN